MDGGLATLRQTLFRPNVSWNPYRTPLPGVYLCSASTPPGGRGPRGCVGSMPRGPPWTICGSQLGGAFAVRRRKPLGSAMCPFVAAATGRTASTATGEEDKHDEARRDSWRHPRLGGNDRKGEVGHRVTKQNAASGAANNSVGTKAGGRQLQTALTRWLPIECTLEVDPPQQTPENVAGGEPDGRGCCPGTTARRQGTKRGPRTRTCRRCGSRRA